MNASASLSVTMNSTCRERWTKVSRKRWRSPTHGEPEREYRAAGAALLVPAVVAFCWLHRSPARPTFRHWLTYSVVALGMVFAGAAPASAVVTGPVSANPSPYATPGCLGLDTPQVPFGSLNYLNSEVEPQVEPAGEPDLKVGEEGAEVGVRVDRKGEEDARLDSRGLEAH